MQGFIDGVFEVLHILRIIVTTKIFYVTFFTWFFAQTLKVLFFFAAKRKFDFRLFVGTGGMPSSHTAAVTAGAVSVGMTLGWDSPVFMVALLFCIVVISDAMGVRRAAGKQAVILNKMMDELWTSEFKYEKRLKEWLGHTPLEAMAGIIIGILLPVIMF
jgi:acid phosphatase family membrane protein YuiD